MRKWLPLLTVCLGTFMLLIDVTIVNVALPDMVTDLGTSFAALQWVVNIYALALAALVLGAGALADLAGHRRVAVAGLTVFAVSSLCCGLAPTTGVLIAARAAQGVGAAAMFATTFALINRSYTGPDRGTAYGIWGAVAGASAAVGPLLGGLLTGGASWRWIFLVNLPVSVAAVALCLTRLPDDRPSTRGRVDVGGTVAFTAAAACATYALVRANEDGWSSSAVAWPLGAAVALTAVFVLVERRTPHAMFDLALLRERAFTGVLLAGFLMTVAAFAAFTYTSVWLQSVRGLSPLETGFTGLPMSVTSFGVSALLGRRLHAGRPDRVIGAGLLLVGAGGLVTALFLRGDAGWTALIPGFALVGVGVGMVTPVLGAAATALVPAERGGMAAGAVNTARQLGFAFGIAALGSVFAARARAAFEGRGVPDADAAAHAVAGGQAPGLPTAVPSGAVHAAAVSGVQATYVVSGAAGVLAGLLVLALMRPHRSPATGPAPVPEPATR
ncbi:MFS transporter [Streptomyces sp. MS19]|uniref:MFS transporter n=1 Tax=Streptomyces sp. MS19 TaxID=3385972 RepID=UPI0039A319BA